MYRVRLTPEQCAEHRRRTQIPDLDPAVRKRLEMIRLAHWSYTIPQIAARMQQHAQTVRYWIKAFLKGGFDALEDKPHGGKVSQLTPAVLEAVIADVRASKQTWTAVEIAEWTAQQHQIRISPGRMRVHLRRAKLSYKRTSRSLRHKQNAEEVQAKEACLYTLKKGAMPL